MNNRILVVDDMPELLGAVRRMLSPRFDVHVASTGDEALDLCESEGPFAVVIADDGMPGMNGMELLARLRSARPDTTRIMMTGFADLELAIKALHEGHVFRFLTKPFRQTELVDAVKAGVEHYKVVAEERSANERLQISRQSLLSLTEALESRLAAQVGRLRWLQRLSLRLTDTQSLGDVADVTAAITHRLLGERSIEVSIESSEMSSPALSRRGEPLTDAGYPEPICSREGFIGMIRVSERDTSGKHMSENDREILRSIACLAALAAHNHISRLACDLAHDATIVALTCLAQNRDDETGKHLERVSRFSELLAETLRSDERDAEAITDAFIKDIKTAAPLHDIGKVGIPDSILLKPGKLDEQEWELMRRHPDIGARTMQQVIDATGATSVLSMGLEVAASHHEKWDGSGYPLGTQGTDIPLSARIVALADCYDALTTWRPYKGPWKHEEARAYLVEQSGKHFDPNVVVAFMKRAEDFDQIRGSLADTREEVAARLSA